jgi:hypothetical protein
MTEDQVWFQDHNLSIPDINIYITYNLDLTSVMFSNETVCVVKNRHFVCAHS